MSITKTMPLTEPKKEINLTFIGRLTKKELVFLRMNKLNRSAFRVYGRMLIVFSIVSLVGEVLGKPSFYGLISRLLLMYILVSTLFLFIYIFCIYNIYAKVKPADYDTKLVLTEEKIILDVPGKGIVVLPAGNIEFRELRLGILGEATNFFGFRNRAFYFFLPFRVLAPNEAALIKETYF